MLSPRSFAIAAVTSALFATSTFAEYNPVLGRFLQRDPVASGLPVQNDSAWFHGQPPRIDPSIFDAQEQYADGMNLFQYVGSNPANQSDPLGLEWDDFDDAIGGLYQDRLTAYGYTRDALGRAQRGAFLAQLYARMAFAWDDFVWDQNEAAIYSLALGGFFARACFEEGTPVVFDNGTTRPIEHVRVGERVMSWPSEPGVCVLDRVVNPAEWRLIRLEAHDEERGTISIALLRDLTWVSEARAEAGKQLRLVVPEMAIYCFAQVCSVELCPAEAAGPIAGLVTGVFETERATLVSVYVDSLPEPIGATASHPFYSLDRNGWVGAGDLKAGERVRTAHGEATIHSIDVRSTPQMVYNLEVQDTHTYFVSKAMVWVHNGCVPEGVKGNLRLFKGWLKSTARTALKEGVALAEGAVREIIAEAKQLGMAIGRAEKGGPRSGQFKDIWHIHIGDTHVPCPPDFKP